MKCTYAFVFFAAVLMQGFLFSMHSAISKTYTKARPAQSENELCLVCVQKNGHIKTYTDIYNHYLYSHGLHARVVYVCDFCDFAGSRPHIKRHIKHAHQSLDTNLCTFMSVHIPTLHASKKSDAHMQDYVERATALLNEHARMALPNNTHSPDCSLE